MDASTSQSSLSSQEEDLPEYSSVQLRMGSRKESLEPEKAEIPVESVPSRIDAMDESQSRRQNDSATLRRRSIRTEIKKLNGAAAFPTAEAAAAAAAAATKDAPAETTEQTIRLPTRLHGCASQLAKLDKIFDESILQVQNGTSPHPTHHRVLLIVGPPGTGKTALVTNLRNRLKPCRGHFVHYSADPQTVLQVAPGFRSTLANMMRDILARPPEEIQELREQLRGRFDDTRIAMATQKFPAMKAVLGETSISEEEIRTKSYGYDYMGIRQFVSALHSPAFPLIFAQDNFHWMDPGSLNDWATGPIQDEDPRGGLMVYCFDPAFLNDGNQPQPLWYKVIEELREQENVLIETIEMGNLNEEETKSMVEDMLGIDQSEIRKSGDTTPSTSSLSSSASCADAPRPTCSSSCCPRIFTWVYNQTNGNPLYIQELVTELFEEGLLHYDTDTRQWRLDQATANENWEGNDTVIQYLTTELEQLPPRIQEALSIGACLGCRFHPGIWQKSLPTEYNTDEQQSLQLLEALIRTQVIEPTPGNSFSKSPGFSSCDWMRFTNNSLHAAALALVGPEDLPKFHRTIARRIVRNCPDDEHLDGELLTVMGQFIFGVDAIESQEEATELAELALRAAKLCVKYGSFPSACKALRFGIHLLGDQRCCWRDHYELTLAIHNALAEAGYASGDTAMVDVVVDTIERHVRSFDDSLPGIITKLHILSSTDRFEDVIDLGLQVLDKLGERLPKNPTKAQSLISFHRTRRLMKGFDTDKLLREGKMATDLRKVSALQIFSILFKAYYILDPMKSILPITRGVQLTIKHGLCNVSSVIFSAYGNMVCGFAEDREEGMKLGNLALALLDKFQTKSFLPRVYVHVYAFIQAWAEPRQRDELHQAYRVGLETGDIEVRHGNEHGFGLLVWCSQVLYFNP